MLLRAVCGFVGAAVLAWAGPVQAGGCYSYGGCADPCASGACGVVVTPARLLNEPQQAYQIVMEPSYVTELRSVCCTEYKDEQRTRAVTVTRTVPVTEERVRTKTVMVPQEEKRTIQYTETVGVKSEKDIEYTVTVPVWTDVEEPYTIKVPKLKDVEETYTIKVPMLTDVEFKYLVNVPHPETTVRTRTVTNVVPVVKKRQVAHCVPVNKTVRVTRDYGQWVNQVVEVPSTSCAYGCSPGYGHGHCASGHCGHGHYGCASCGPVPTCGHCVPVTTTVCKKVWVPNLVTEDVTVVEQTTQIQDINYLVYEQHSEPVQYECTRVVFKPEERSATKTVVSYKDVTVTRTKKDVEYVDEPRMRIKKVLTFKEEPRKETYPVITYVKEPKTKDITYTVMVPKQEVEKYTVTRHDCVTEKAIEPYTVKVPVASVKLVPVQVCKMVPKAVGIMVNPCADCVGHCTPAAPACCGAPVAPVCCR